MAELNRLLRKAKRAILRDEPTYYDMFENPGERYFGRIYLHFIRQALQRHGFTAPLKLLDAGCQAGRLAIPLARDGHSVIGVDTSDVALRRARRHAAEQGTKLDLARADLARWLPRCQDASFDGVLCAEVLYLRSNFRTLLQELIRVLRPGGLCFISHRPTAFYLAEAFQRRDWDAVRVALSQKEGTLFGSYYNWHDREELGSLYRSLGVELLEIRTVGILSWLAVNPEDLEAEQQELLFQADVDHRTLNEPGGRYLLAIGKKL